jgi:hypothetical protein
MLLAAGTFAGLLSLPANFGYVAFALLIFLNGVAFGLFAAPNTTSIMNSVPAAMLHGLTANGVPATRATTLSHLPAVSYLFAAFLGYNPTGSLLGPKLLGTLSAAHRATLTSHSFFPQLISDPFKHGVVIILTFSIVMCLLAAWASWLRGGKYIHHEELKPPPRSRTPTAATPSAAK